MAFAEMLVLKPTESVFRSYYSNLLYKHTDISRDLSWLSRWINL